ncbi:adenylate/guanylate cyclase domain-containing protein [Variovorax robiniae]|uniref:Adenylate/guanylate cyclase domain-containing protein n=1 Tax=Variovorax robiniae TaxID=1836199 RepID=A0ABU8XB34_9BURK
MLPTRHAIVLVIDLVESVRVMEADEGGVIQRWYLFTNYVNQKVLPERGGRLVKNLGDGLMAEFGTAHGAVLAANAMHEWMANECEPLKNGERLGLRAGIHATRIFDGTTDIYGIGVNLAARVASLGESGETIATAQLRDLLSDTLDADVEDLGDCHLKHVERPVRAFRLGPARHAWSLPRERSYETPLHASVAVIPFSNMLASEEFWGVGDLLADGIIGALSPSQSLRVVSRLSSANFKARSSSLAEIANRLDVRYVVSGTYAVVGADVTIAAELADAATGHILWSDRVRSEWRGLLSLESEVTHQLADAVHRKLLETTVSKAGTRPLPALNSYELFLGGVSMMHRANADDFELSRRLLESLTQRHHRVATPHAWLGKWYVLRAIQGATNDLAESAALALQHTHKALDLEPASGLALAIEGFVYGHLKKDLVTAESRLSEACLVNPNEGFAWLFLAVMHAFQGNSPAALAAGHRALSLSPMDPLRYYYESLMGSCEFGAGNLPEAIRWCEASRRRNRQHLSTLRILIAAYAELGEMAQSRALGEEVRRLRPAYTVAGYEANSVAALYPFGQRIAKAMRAAGVP